MLSARSSPGLDLQLSHHCENTGAQVSLACSSSWDHLRIPRHLFGQESNAHARNIICSVALRLWVVFYVPLLGASHFHAVAHVRPPVQEGCVCLSDPSLRAHDMRTPSEKIRLLESVVVRVARLILENRRECARNPVGDFVSITNKSRLVNLWRI